MYNMKNVTCDINNILCRGEYKYRLSYAIHMQYRLAYELSYQLKVDCYKIYM